MTGARVRKLGPSELEVRRSTAVTGRNAALPSSCLLTLNQHGRISSLAQCALRIATILMEIAVSAAGWLQCCHTK